MTNLGPLLEAAHRRIRRRSLIVLVSDFIGVPGWERPLELLNRRHELLAVRLVDPREVELPDVGPVMMQDAETGEQLYVNTADARFRRRFRAAADALNEAGVWAVSYVSPGTAHEWQSWRRSLYSFAPLLFRD